MASCADEPRPSPDGSFARCNARVDPETTMTIADLLPVVISVALVGCDTGMDAPNAPRPGAASVPETTPTPAAEPVLAPSPAVEPRPEPEPELLPVPEPEPVHPGLAARVEPTRPSARSPYPPRLEQLLVSPPSEPLVPEAASGDAAAWARAGDKAIRKKRYVDAMRAFASAAKLEPTVWKHPFGIARAAARFGDEETCEIALAQSYLLDCNQTSDAAYHRDLKPFWSKSWFVRLGVGALSVVLGNETDWQPHGLVLDSVTVRFIEGDPVLLQIHAGAEVLDVRRELDWVVWATSCKRSDRVYTELDTMDRRFSLEFLDASPWRHTGAVDYDPSLALANEPEACEFRFYRLPRPRPPEPLESSPVWMADFCWTRGKPYHVGMAREGRCGFERAAGPNAAFAVESLDVEAVEREGTWVLDQTFDIIIGKEAGQWKTVEVETTCHCGADECKRRDLGRMRHDRGLWFVEAGEHVRVRETDGFEPGQKISECLIEIGTLGPYPWGAHSQYDGELDVVARYCYRNGTTSEGACG
jgi:hypothetical protein